MIDSCHPTDRVVFGGREGRRAKALWPGLAG
jgi:hypothetical protein